MEATVRAFIFDFDGTILDTETHEFRRWEELYREHGQVLALQDWQQGVGTWGAFDPWAALELDEDTRRSAHDRLRADIFKAIAADDVRPGIRRVLAEAREAGVRLAIASSSERAWIEPWLEQHGLQDVFEVLATRDDVARVKPDPELYSLALARLGLQPGEAVAVEDSFHGATAAHRAGLRVIVTPNDVTSGQPFLDAWPRVDSLEGGLNVLLGAVGAPPVQVTS
ncbi:HAD family hydrolase [Deinococcus yavapaiensis]|uniref:HAD superfamily phosphoserine phosphatase-like hydrolase/HAD superfamily hydrolase (TIGR01509 family) n=1 Tax=Deinococcus yavapaiensis KR-236 TaxID=694435 RepID=A0A318RZA5_9DEIO|nr:HAD family hydrolase [Deinococcus yavapaiensis]PYE48699.1 HAD superfamily phosphoserine phosphatase-like hydrolase/HAD superfamily hydrolase (TIGR01509 family) [Deinococcus yavapaiensis KR-236]